MIDCPLLHRVFDLGKIHKHAHAKIKGGAVSVITQNINKFPSLDSHSHRLYVRRLKHTVIV